MFFGRGRGVDLDHVFTPVGTAAVGVIGGRLILRRLSLVVVFAQVGFVIVVEAENYVKETVS